MGGLLGSFMGVEGSRVGTVSSRSLGLLQGLLGLGTGSSLGLFVTLLLSCFRPSPGSFFLHVKTPVGITEKNTISNTIMQGETF